MAEINVTPMVDVMLVLLIIFMVTAPLLVAGVPVDLPESRRALDQERRAGHDLDRRATAQVFVDDAPVPEGGALGRASPASPRRRASRAARSSSCAPTAALDYGRVMAVMGEINRAGLRSVALVTTGIGRER